MNSLKKIKYWDYFKLREFDIKTLLFFLAAAVWRPRQRRFNLTSFIFICCSLLWLSLLAVTPDSGV